MCITRAQIEAQSHRSQQYLEPPSAPSQSREIEAARIAQLEDLLERGASEKRDLQNQVCCYGIDGNYLGIAMISLYGIGICYVVL